MKYLFILYLALAFLLNSYAQETLELNVDQLAAVNLDGEKLNVIATTSIIGDIVAQVAADEIDLTVLIQAGQDPHSYEPNARALTTVSKADIIFINGWNLEENLIGNLESVAKSPLIAVSANIEPLEYINRHNHGDESENNHSANEEKHRHAGADPHVWQDVTLVMQWVKNIQQVLTQLDPSNANSYEANARSYLTELEDLAAYAANSLATIPQENRFIVSNHNSFSYLAVAHDLEVVGTILPSNSSLAEPSAADLVGLVRELKFHNMCALFTESNLSDRLAQIVAKELDHCENVQVLKLYTDALGTEGSNAETYLDMIRSNIDTLVQGLSN